MKRLGVILAVVAMAGCSSSADRLPDVEVGRLDTSETVTLSALQGPAVVNVWLTTCTPCVREMPLLAQAASENAQVDFYGLNLAESPDAVTAFIEDLGVDYPQLLDDKGYAAEALGIDTLPTTIVIDADGEIVKRHRGEIDRAGLDEALAAAQADS